MSFHEYTACVECDIPTQGNCKDCVLYQIISKTAFSCQSSYSCPSYSFIEYDKYFSCNSDNCSSALLINSHVANCTSYSCQVTIDHQVAEQCVGTGCLENDVECVQTVFCDDFLLMDAPDHYMCVDSCPNYVQLSATYQLCKDSARCSNMTQYIDHTFFKCTPCDQFSYVLNNSFLYCVNAVNCTPAYFYSPSEFQCAAGPANIK